MRGWYYIKFPELPPGIPVWQELKTDQEGKCLVHDLPPALYYAQAVKDNQTSLTVPLHPCCGGASLQLIATSNVMIIVKRKGMENQENSIAESPNSEITLKGVEGTTGLLSTLSRAGGTILNVSYGEYLLKVNPAEGQPEEKRVTVQHPKEKFELLISGYEQYDLSGIVIDEDTKQPVAGYDLQIDQLGCRVKSGKMESLFLPVSRQVFIPLLHRFRWIEKLNICLFLQ